MDHHYALGVEWRGNRGAGTTGYRDYDRDVVVTATGKPSLEGSADRPFRGDPSRWNPEELLLAALAQCHLLSYLHLAVLHGVVVTAYADDAVGTLRQEGIGGRFTGAVLRPRVEVASPDMVGTAAAIHAPAHEACFIAASVAFPVEIDAPRAEVRTPGAGVTDDA